jgi:hypothetical protein
MNPSRVREEWCLLRRRRVCSDDEALSFAKMLSASKSRRLIEMKGSRSRSLKLEGQRILDGWPTSRGKEPCELISIVDNFVAARALNFNKIQQNSTSRPQTLQRQSLKINKNP